MQRAQPERWQGPRDMAQPCSMAVETKVHGPRYGLGHATGTRRDVVQASALWHPAGAQAAAGAGSKKGWSDSPAIRELDRNHGSCPEIRLRPCCRQAGECTAPPCRRWPRERGVVEDRRAGAQRPRLCNTQASGTRVVDLRACAQHATASSASGGPICCTTCHVCAWGRCLTDSSSRQSW